MLYGNFNSAGWGPHREGRDGGLLACGHTPRRSPGTNWTPAPARLWVSLRAPARLFLQMDPLVPSPEPCSEPGERCFLRQPWLQPLQLEQPGTGWGLGGGVELGPRGWELALVDPISIVLLEFFQGPG